MRRGRVAAILLAGGFAAAATALGVAAVSGSDAGARDVVVASAEFEGQVARTEPLGVHPGTEGEWHLVTCIAAGEFGLAGELYRCEVGETFAVRVEDGRVVEVADTDAAPTPEVTTTVPQGTTPPEPVIDPSRPGYSGGDFENPTPEQVARIMAEQFTEPGAYDLLLLGGKLREANPGGSMTGTLDEVTIWHVSQDKVDRSAELLRSWGFEGAIVGHVSHNGQPHGWEVTTTPGMPKS